jgi:hypothetical protein
VITAFGLSAFGPTTHPLIETPQPCSIDEMLKVHLGADYIPEHENSRKILLEKWQSQYLPLGWERHDFVEDKGGMTVTCMASRVKNPKAEIRFLLGFKAIPQAYERVVRFWNGLGYDGSVMMLPYTDRHCGLIKSYDYSTHQFLTDDTLGVHQSSKKDIPKIIVTHSTGGLCLNRNRLSPDNERLYSSQYILNIQMASFFGMAGANPVYNPKQYDRFKRYAADEKINWYTREIARNPKLDQTPRETWAGRSYIEYLRYFKKDPDIFSSIDDPTLRQMNELTAAAEDYYESMKAAKTLDYLLRTHYIIANNDTVACPNLQRDIAVMQGASYKGFDAFHSVAIESKEGLKYITQLIENSIANHSRRVIPRALLHI